ncbi:MAG: 30S ribosome-binding factor RbfA [Clostridia bacterium]|nr:30S ribosome-binding factor RbfA [Clostridia bacterium]
MKETRLGRVDSEIQTALSEIFTYQISSPELKGTMISIVSCKTTNDLRHCRVLISIFPDKDKEKKFFAVKETIPFVRRELAQKVNLRVVPELQFELDNSAEYGAKIDKIIEDLHRDRKN